MIKGWVIVVLICFQQPGGKCRVMPDMISHPTKATCEIHKVPFMRGMVRGFMKRGHDVERATVRCLYVG